jgi:hypothetical protein
MLLQKVTNSKICGGGEKYFYSYFRQCCGSGMFIPDPGSRIQKQQQKREVKKNICHTFLCSHKFHKIVNYWANFQRII